jgi:hypothetical protein
VQDLAEGSPRWTKRHLSTEERSLSRGTPSQSLRSCPGCGGQFAPHTSVCPWCGRSVILGIIVQLGVAGVLLLGVATLTGIIDWSRLVHSVVPQGMTAAPDVAQPTARVTGAGGKPLVDRAFEALPAPNPAGKGAQPPSCNVSDSARLSRIDREHADWNDQVRALISCRQVRPGFNVDQLRAAMGRPAKVVRSDSGGEEWIYKHVRVIVKDGQVVAVKR